MTYGDAYFYRPGKIPADNLKNFKHVIGQSYDGNLGLRLLKMNIDMLLGYRKPQVEGPEELSRATSGYVQAQYVRWSDPDYNVGGTWRDGATFTLKEFVDKYHRNEAFFLHAANGQRLRSYDKGRYFYLIRPNMAAKQWWSDVAAIHKREPHWKGPFIDNVGIDDDKLHEVLREMKLSGPIQEYAGGPQAVLYQQDWAEFLDVGRLTMPQGTILGANLIGDWFAQRDATVLIDRLDLIMLEAYAPWLNMRASFKPEHSLNIVKRAQSIVDAGKHLICVIHLSSKDTPERAAYEYMRYLLIAGERASCRLVVDGSYSGVPYHIPEMELDLGKPLQFELAGSGYTLWRRFENALLKVDLAAMTYAVTRNTAPTPVDPRDAQIATLQEQVRGVLEREQQYKQMVAELQKTVSDLQTRLATGVVVKF